MRVKGSYEITLIRASQSRYRHVDKIIDNDDRS